jgi:hypothetical protein
VTAMDAWPFGAEHWRAAVYPRSTGRQPISFEQIGALSSPVHALLRRSGACVRWQERAG